MRNLTALVLLSALLMFPAWGYQEEPACDAPALSEQAVKNIIEKERAARTDLPAPFPEFRWEVRREGCYYVYLEYAIPEVFHQVNIFRLNQNGVIVDVGPEEVPPPGRGQLKCPDKVLTESELAEVVRKERGKRRNIPPPFANQETRVERVRCLYLYFEYAVPKKKGHYQVFTIDPLGEVMDVQRGKSEQ